MVRYAYGKAAKPETRDLGDEAERSPIGFRTEDRPSFRLIRSTQTGVGLIGFEFHQYGVQYQAFYMDDTGNDVERYQVTVPKASPFLHKSGSVIGIAEKIHILHVVRSMLDPDIKKNLLSPLYRLEKACFYAGTGTISSGNIGLRVFPKGEAVICHAGLSFPDDSDYLAKPRLTTMAMEWIGGIHYHLIDLSNYEPRFIKASANSPELGRRYMTRGEAVAATHHAQKSVKQAGGFPSFVARQARIWDTLEGFVNEGFYTVPNLAP